MIDLDDIVPLAPVEQLIGTETCSYCYTLTECLSLPDDGDTERHACRHCVTRAFDDVLGGSIQADEDPNGPERIRVIVRPGKDDWIGVAYSSSVEPNDVIREYVRPQHTPRKETRE